MFAIGICACGSATGGLVYPAMFQQLIHVAGYGWTMRALAFATMDCLIICNILARPRIPPYNTGPIVDLTAFTEMPYSLFAIGIFLTFWGVQTCQQADRPGRLDAGLFRPTGPAKQAFASIFAEQAGHGKGEGLVGLMTILYGVLGGSVDGNLYNLNNLMPLEIS